MVDFFFIYLCLLLFCWRELRVDNVLKEVRFGLEDVLLFETLVDREILEVAYDFQEFLLIP